MMSEIYDKVSKNIINNLQNINFALENIKIDSKVLTPAFTEKLEKIKSIVNDENQSINNSSVQLSPSFNYSDNVRQYTRQDLISAFSRIKALPKEFAPVKVKSEKKPVGKSVSYATNAMSRGNLTRAGSLQILNDNSRPTSRSNSISDIAAEVVPKPPLKVEELLQKINENKQMLEGIKASTLECPKTTNFGEERFKLATEFKKALAEITEMVNILEQNVKGIKNEDVDLALDDELNEMLEQFTKTIKDYNFLQQNSTIELDTNLNDHELEFPYSPLLHELKAFLERY